MRAFGVDPNHGSNIQTQVLVGLVSGTVSGVLGFVTLDLFSRRTSLGAPLDHSLPQSRQSRRRSVSGAPGARFMRGARILFSKKNVERVLEPIHSDFWIEYQESLAAGERWHARWIRVRFAFTFVGTAATLIPAKALRKIWDLAMSQ